VVLPFDAELSSMTAAQFLAEIVARRFHARALLAGHDQAIGTDQLRGESEIERAAEPYGIHVFSTGPVKAGARTISSTAIRRHIVKGKLAQAVDALGAPYPLSGQVVHGQGEGRSLGYPTANIAVSDRHKLVPADGIYAAIVQVLADDTNAGEDVPPERVLLSAGGMLYIGARPTFYENGSRTVEVALLDFEGDLYGARLRLHILERLRGDRKFDTRKELVDQIGRDEEQTRRMIPQKPVVPVDGTTHEP